MKRKAENAETASKVPKSTFISHPNKRSKNTDTKSNTKGAIEKPAPKSVLQIEERAFPRGGASVLTPLEHKQIQIEATQDVLFEQGDQGKKHRAAEGSDNEDDEDDENIQDESVGKAPRSKRKRKVMSKSKREVKEEAKTAKIEGLSYKKLLPGTLILGRVSKITSRDVALALPNNLTGYVPLTAVSDPLNRRVEKLLADEEEDKMDVDDGEAFDDVDLKKCFRLGQFLRASITAPGIEGGSGSKKHIELSLNPRLCNYGMLKEEIQPYMMLQASVISVEDHGLVMGLNLDDSDIKGFLPISELGDLEQTSIEEGSVLLCMATNTASDDRVVHLTIDAEKIGSVKNTNFLSSSPSVKCFLPGTAVEILVTENEDAGLRGKLMGMVDVTADVIHTGIHLKKDIAKRFPIGDKIKGRILFSFPPDSNQQPGVSLLRSIIKFQESTEPDSKAKSSENAVISAIVNAAKVVQVQPKIGLLFDIGASHYGLAHISRISDKKIESLPVESGPYKVGSKHQARIIGYNPVDGLYILSLEQKVISQPYLRIEDVPIGKVIKCTVEKLVSNDNGVNGIRVNLADGISGMVSAIHMADVQLQHPERKFKPGMSTNVRVLSTNTEKRTIWLTMKKSLVNSDIKPWTTFEDIELGDQGPGTLVNILPAGAVVQFYGSVRGFLPVSEMSEAYIKDPRDHFKVGQVVTVRVLDVNLEDRKMTLSCKDPSNFGPAQLKKFNKFKVGGVTKGSITELASDMVTLDIGDGIRGLLRVQHLSDGSLKKSSGLLKKLRVGQLLLDLVIIEKRDNSHMLIVSHKPDFVRAARAGKLCTAFFDLRVGNEYTGFIRNIQKSGIFVEFAGGIVALLPPHQLEKERQTQSDFGYEIGQTIVARVHNLIPETEKISLTTKTAVTKAVVDNKVVPQGAVVNPVDDTILSQSDLTLGRVLKAKITGVKLFQLNVTLADGVQGRIDATEVFDKWEDIKDRKRPIHHFKHNQVVPVRIIGIHDIKSKRFLPLSFRHGTSVFELSSRGLDSDDPSFVLTTDKLKVGEQVFGIIYKHEEKYVWVKLSPAVRSRVSLMDLSEDISKLDDIDRNFPLGSAVKLYVKSVDEEANRVRLSAKSSEFGIDDASNIQVGSVLSARVRKAHEARVIVQIGESITGVIPRIELSDDYSKADPQQFSSNDIIKVCVITVDIPNKRAVLSARKSRVLSSKSAVEDRQLLSISDVKVNDVIRGFVKWVSDRGVFVTIGHDLTAFVRIADLSDAFIRDWKSTVQVDQLVQGKITRIDPELSHIQMALKASVVDKNYVPKLSFEDIKEGDIYTAKVRKVETYGVFIVVDNSDNVSGLCHHSQIADSKVEDVRKLYDVGDTVKAKVVKIDKEKHRVNFGLKASYFKNDAKDDNDHIAGEDTDFEEDDDNIEDDEMAADGLEHEPDEAGAEALAAEGQAQEFDAAPVRKSMNGLQVRGFDWTGGMDNDDAIVSESEAETSQKRKKKQRPEIQVDKTGELDKFGPRGVADFERLLLGKPNSSSVWIQYMAFQLGLGEVDKARTIADRAFKTISMREEDEKLNVWIAYLNLENTYGSEEAVEDVFKQACSYNDKQEMHERLLSIFIESGKHDKADELFQRMTHMKEITAQIPFWLNYATFLLTTRSQHDAARALLLRATQSVPTIDHRTLTAKFGALEFTSPSGDKERGRTIFEGLLSAYPKRWDVWDMYADLERSHGLLENVRALYERMAKAKMKKKRAKFVFKKWAAVEEAMGEEGDVGRVTTLAAEYVRKVNKEGENEDMDDS